MKRNIVIIVILSILLLGCKSVEVRNMQETYNVKTEKKCQEKDGYWYKGKCWANFREYDDGIKVEDIDSLVDAQIKQINNSKFIIDNNELSDKNGLA